MWMLGYLIEVFTINSLYTRTRIGQSASHLFLGPSTALPTSVQQHIPTLSPQLGSQQHDFTRFLQRSFQVLTPDSSLLWVSPMGSPQFVHVPLTPCLPVWGGSIRGQPKRRAAPVTSPHPSHKGRQGTRGLTHTLLLQSPSFSHIATVNPNLSHPALF